MDISEWVGSLVSFLAMTYLILSGLGVGRKKTSPPPQGSDQEKTLEEFMRSLDEDMEAHEENPQPLPPVPRPLPTYQKPILLYKKKEQLPNYWQDPASDPYKLKKTSKPSRIKHLLFQAKSQKDMVLFYEVIGKPKGWRR